MRSGSNSVAASWVTARRSGITSSPGRRLGPLLRESSRVRPGADQGLRWAPSVRARQGCLDDGRRRNIASFLDEGQIDEFRVHVIPVFIGEGIPLMEPRHRLVPLKLLGTRRFPDGRTSPLRGAPVGEREDTGEPAPREETDQAQLITEKGRPCRVALGYESRVVARSLAECETVRGWLAPSTSWPLPSGT
jgi:hypothetical protein